MGVVPLQFVDDQSAQSLGLTGKEKFTVNGVGASVEPGSMLSVTATSDDGSSQTFDVLCRVDTAVEAEYYEHGGLLPYVLRQMIAQNDG